MITIIGSGPAGYTAAIYAARAGREPVVIAGAVTGGGALMNTTEIENYPGFPEDLTGPELMQKIRAQAEKFGARIIEQDAVRLELAGDTKRVYLGGGEVVESAAVIIATGTEYRKLGVPGEERLSAKGVSWCATCDGFFFRGKIVAVVGGGDSAMEEAIFLTKFAEKVYVIHRSRSLRASKILQERALNNPKIEFIWNSRVVEISGEETVTGITLAPTGSSGDSSAAANPDEAGDLTSLALDGVFIAIGSDPRTALVKDQLELNETGNVQVVGRRTHTSLPGVFAAGDVVDPVYRQAIVAAGSGASAAIDAELYLTEKLS